MFSKMFGANIANMFNPPKRQGTTTTASAASASDLFDDLMMPHALRGSRKAQDTRIRVTLTLEEIYRGCVKDVQFKRTILSASETTTGRVESAKLVVPRGCKPGAKIVIEGVGDRMAGMKNGDLIVIVEQAEHPVFTRVEDDLHAVVTISFADVVFGRHIRIRSVDEAEEPAIEHYLAPPITTTRKLTFPNRGMRAPDGQPLGNLYVALQLLAPKHAPRVIDGAPLSDEERVRFRDYLESMH
jgi:DnaJ-class molecular chaperone